MKTQVIYAFEPEYTRADVHAKRDEWIEEVNYLKKNANHTYWSRARMNDFLRSFDDFYWMASTTLISMLDLKDGIRTMIAQFNQANPKSKIAWHVSDQLM